VDVEDGSSHQPRSRDLPDKRASLCQEPLKVKALLLMVVSNLGKNENKNNFVLAETVGCLKS